MKQEGTGPAYLADRFTAIVIFISVFVIVATIAIAVVWFFYQPLSYLQVSILDVGQGDATLIKTINDKIILIDAGPNKKILQRLGEELPFWQRKIDLVILTHPHDDHFGGLLEVVKRYQVGTIILNNIECSDYSFKQLMSTIKSTQTKIIIYNGPEDFIIDGVKVALLYPKGNVSNKHYDNANNSSLVTRLSFNNIDFLLTGDSEVKDEAEILKSSTASLESEVIKLGHHGSDTSSSEDFLKVAQPIVAVISVGKDNTYGHPSALILKRLERLNIPSYRTDLLGTIDFKTNGQWLKINKTCLIANCPL
jgi:competence protein ComEC